MFVILLISFVTTIAIRELLSRSDGLPKYALSVLKTEAPMTEDKDWYCASVKPPVGLPTSSSQIERAPTFFTTARIATEFAHEAFNGTFTFSVSPTFAVTGIV